MKYIALFIALSLGVASTAQAALNTTFLSLGVATGDNSKLDVTMTELAGGSIQFDLVVDEAVAIADISGFYFDLIDTGSFGSLTLTDVSNPSVPLGTLTANAGNLGNGINMNGGGAPNSYDYGFLVGNSGGINGGDDYQSVSFTLTDSDGLITIADFDALAARHKSVGAGRNGSTKLYNGTIPPGTPITNPAVPEPSTYAMFGAAFLILGVAGYRSRNRKS